MTADPLADIRAALADIAARMVTREDLGGGISGVREDLRGEISGIRADVLARMATRDDLAAVRAEMTGIRADLRQ